MSLHHQIQPVSLVGPVAGTLGLSLLWLYGTDPLGVLVAGLAGIAVYASFFGRKPASAAPSAPQVEAVDHTPRSSAPLLEALDAETDHRAMLRRQTDKPGLWLARGAEADLEVKLMPWVEGYPGMWVAYRLRDGKPAVVSGP